MNEPGPARSYSSNFALVRVTTTQKLSVFTWDDRLTCLTTSIA